MGVSVDEVTEFPYYKVYFKLEPVPLAGVSRIHFHTIKSILNSL